MKNKVTKAFRDAVVEVKTLTPLAIADGSSLSELMRIMRMSQFRFFIGPLKPNDAPITISLEVKGEPVESHHGYSSTNSCNRRNLLI